MTRLTTEQVLDAAEEHVRELGVLLEIAEGRAGSLPVAGLLRTATEDLTDGRLRETITIAREDLT